MNRLQILKIQQLVLDNTFDVYAPNQYLSYLKEYFNGDEDEVNDLLKWRKEDKEFYNRINKTFR